MADRPLWSYAIAGLRCEVWPGDDVPGPVLAELTRMYREVADMSADDFAASVAAKDFAVAMRDESGEVVGTLVAAWTQVPHPRTGSPAWLLGVHHTSIRPAWRGKNVVQVSGLQLLFRHRMRHPLAPTYWLFDTFSWHSYLGMARNFPASWPTAARPSFPPDEAAIVRAAMAVYPEAWDEAAGVLRWGGRKLRESEAVPPAERVASDPDIGFFVAANPGYVQGDCLVCLASLAWRHVALAAWTSFVGRPLRRVFRRHPGQVVAAHDP
ncbi:MAG: hypothetical protein H6735_24870 [Alphaproteobacteria bacterium]|nr:hypothetical protein [Alphaproteobacteria bacterium]